MLPHRSFKLRLFCSLFNSIWAIYSCCVIPFWQFLSIFNSSFKVLFTVCFFLLPCVSSKYYFNAFSYVKLSQLPWNAIQIILPSCLVWTFNVIKFNNLNSCKLFSVSQAFITILFFKSPWLDFKWIFSSFDASSVHVIFIKALCSSKTEIAQCLRCRDAETWGLQRGNRTITPFQYACLNGLESMVCTKM